LLPLLSLGQACFAPRNDNFNIFQQQQQRGKNPPGLVENFRQG